MPNGASVRRMRATPAPGIGSRRSSTPPICNPSQPGAAARIQTAMIIGLALIESLAIYVLVVAMILLFVQPIK